MVKSKKTSFSLNIDKFARLVELRSDVVLRKLGLDGYTGFAQRSPVAEGTFRANIRIAVEQPDLTTEPNLRMEVSGGQAVTPGEITKVLSALRTAKFGQTIFITNNLAYAQPLEDGHSGQAPNGMVSLTIQELTRNFDQVVRQVRRQIK